MFEHSIKVPRHFKISANIVKKVATEGGSVKNLLYDSKLRFFRTNVIYALITETIKHSDDIDKLFEVTGILTKEPRLDPWLAKVITTELLFGKKELPGHSKPEKTIIGYKEQFDSVPLQQVEVKPEVRRPRYVRINTNLLTTSDAIGAFQDEGYKFIRCTSGSYDDYLKQIQGLTEYDFTQDYHVKTMFVFHPNTKFHDHDLYLENKIILQDKATALPVHLLAPPQGSVVLDMCAAPGMKTTQLAAFMRNQGKIYAVERNEERYNTLCDFVNKTDSKCVTTMHRDSLDIKRGEYDDVEYIILDPSCSGSGMQLCIHKYVEDVRLARLTSLQEKFLKHAMNAFPKAKRIVYSTCSLFPEENERVISNVVKLSRAKWKVLNVKDLLKGNWNNFGSGMYGEIGTRCLYAKPDSDLTTGFFLAVLERDPKQSEKTDNTDVKDDSQLQGTLKDRKKSTNNDSNLQQDEAECNSSEPLTTSKHRRKKTSSDDDAQGQTKSKSEYVSEEMSSKKKNKKRTAAVSKEDLECLETESKDPVENVESKKSKKKKRDKPEDSEIPINDNNASVSIEKQEDVNDSKKKKKKNKRKEFSDADDKDSRMDKDVNNSIDLTDTTEDAIYAKKKKKSKHSKNADIQQNDMSDEPVKKKKKKHSHVKD
ncbi:unnamed protein product [Leptosia nina]|uniref:SAM-dependent MTase RsmB/NOP-type domain-containing protein n=1 Tax=Leptosia nina TaxID=320188 RepID=A0AAV1JVB5_9NEOP